MHCLFQANINANVKAQKCSHTLQLTLVLLLLLASAMHSFFRIVIIMCLTQRGSFNNLETSARQPSC